MQQGHGQQGHGHGQGTADRHRHRRRRHTSSASRLKHSLLAAVGGHTHDAAEQVDAALEASAAGRRAVWLSLAALLATATVQAFVVALSGSVALLNDTLHNFADALTAVPLLIAFRLAHRPPTRRFTYGFGRAEDLAGIFVLAMIALSAVVAAWETLDRFVHPRPVTHLPVVAAAAVVGFLGNELVARYRIVVGRRIGSATLVADGLHARADGFTSLGVLASVAGLTLGWAWADPVVGAAIVVALLGVLRGATRRVGARLMDAVDPSLVDDATAILTGVPGVRAVRELRIRWIGHALHVEADVDVPRDLTLRQAHTVAHEAERELLRKLGSVRTATIHVSPSGAHATDR